MGAHVSTKQYQGYKHLTRNEWSKVRIIDHSQTTIIDTLSSKIAPPSYRFNLSRFSSSSRGKSHWQG